MNGESKPRKGDKVVFRHLGKGKAGEVWNFDEHRQTASIFVAKENCLYTGVQIGDVLKKL